MRILGVDFTSTPSRRKPITVVSGRLEEGILHLEAHEDLENLKGFEGLLIRPGPWIAGCDFPFGQARRFVENSGWPLNWVDYVDYVATLSRKQFRAELDAYRAPRAAGDREHRRHTDVLASAISPQKLYGVPVGLMFHEGAPRLRQSGATVPGLYNGDVERVIVEAYPGALVRHMIGKQSYKNDVRSKQAPAQRKVRELIMTSLLEGVLSTTHGIRVEAASDMVMNILDDPMADRLDALLCAIQAAWAWTQRDAGFGAPPGVDTLEGWIAEPTLSVRVAAPAKTFGKPDA